MRLSSTEWLSIIIACTCNNCNKLQPCNNTLTSWCQWLCMHAKSYFIPFIVLACVLAYCLTYCVCNMFSSLPQSLCANPLIIEEDSPMKSAVLLFSSLQGNCRNPVKPVHRTESFRLFIVWWYNKLTFCLCISSNQLLNFGLKYLPLCSYMCRNVRRVETLATVIW